MVYNEKQTAIINAAEKLIAQKGFNGASVRDIAQEADVNVAMISYYFGSKEKLMEAIFESRTKDISLKVENLLADRSLSYLEKVYVLIDEYVEKFLKQQTFHRIMMREQIMETDNPISASILALKRRNLASIKKLIQEGQESGSFKRNIDIPFMMSTMVGTVNHVITSKTFYKECHERGDLSDEEFQKYITRKLSIHLKYLFKQVLTNED
ncbi:MAG: TetR/AcrR family transcriptional regulator [Chitinophagia bacterium]|nr:TetR/AcrR family transcriptional regulator [Chitinophagia bacterium]